MKKIVAPMSQLWDNKPSSFSEVRIYDPARQAILAWPEEARKELGSVLTRLQKRESIGLPDVRPMSTVSQGVAEIRISATKGIYRVLYVIETQIGILVFHGFQKRTQSTPTSEIRLAQRRLKAFYKELGL